MQWGLSHPRYLWFYSSLGQLLFFFNILFFEWRIYRQSRGNWLMNYTRDNHWNEDIYVQKNSIQGVVSTGLKLLAKPPERMYPSLHQNMHWRLHLVSPAVKVELVVWDGKSPMNTGNSAFGFRYCCHYQ